MSDTTIPPMVWIGLAVAVCVIFGMSYFAMKAGNPKSQVREQQPDGDRKHHKSNN